jgi:hypothetical protein
MNVIKPLKLPKRSPKVRPSNEITFDSSAAGLAEQKEIAETMLFGAMIKDLPIGRSP